MKRILTSSEMYLCDRTEIESRTPSRELMRRAARACADRIIRVLHDMPGLPSAPVAVLCGGGNNGGDGLLCARLLNEDGVPACAVTAFGDGAVLSPECAYRYDELIASGTPMLSSAQFLQDLDDPNAYPYCAVVDALFGIGLSREPEGVFAALIDAANAYTTQHGIPAFALDIASGISADTGEVSMHTFRATHTLAISHAKRGHVLYPGAVYTGALSVLDIGIADDVLSAADDDMPVFMLTDADVRALLPAREPDSNKGSNGRVLIAAGSETMCGAALLSALAAYRSGAGLVEIFTAEQNRTPLLTRLPEAIVTTCSFADPAGAAERLALSLSRADAVVVGPGLGQSAAARALVHTVLTEARCPTVIDADALNLLAADGIPASVSSVPRIMTPHPGEMSRLTGLSVATLTQEPFLHAADLARRLGCVVNAKNARSVITDGHRTYLNPTGTCALAKGGSGDVLTGITATLCAQGCDALTAAALAAYLHGCAAESVTARMGVRAPLASEIADAIGAVLAGFDG